MVTMPHVAIQSDAATTNVVLAQELEGTERVGKAKPKTPTHKEEVEAKVKEYWSDVPLMVRVARCESEFRQLNSDGTVMRGHMNRADVGVMQINEHYHKVTAAKLGLDLHTLEGNLEYARYLFEREGTRPWKASRPCWAR